MAVDTSVVDVNYLAVLVAAAADVVIGSIWYSDYAFGKMWRKESGLSEEAFKEGMKKGMMKSMGIWIVGNLLTVYVLSHVVDLIGATELPDALFLGFWLWLGFMVPVQLGGISWEGKSWKYFLINAAHLLVFILLASVIVTLWV